MYYSLTNTTAKEEKIIISLCIYFVMYEIRPDHAMLLEVGLALQVSEKK